MTHRLMDLAAVIRSKNSGPYELTLDILFRDADTYRRVWDSGFFTPERFAGLYHVPVSDVILVVGFPPANAIKATLVRPLVSGDPGDTDIYGAQQHAPLLGLTLELED